MIPHGDCSYIMNVNFQYIKEVLFLIGDDKKRLIGMMLSFLALSVLDLASISIIIPYISLIISPEVFFDNYLAKDILEIIGLEHRFNVVIPYISGLLLLIFLTTLFCQKVFLTLLKLLLHQIVKRK